MWEYCIFRLVGWFFACATGIDDEQELMIGIDLTKETLIEIVVESGETLRKLDLSKNEA